MALDLDKRQRAMLAEMGVRVWMPAASPVVAPAGNEAEPAAEPVADMPVARADAAPPPARARAEDRVPAPAADTRANDEADVAAAALPRAAWLIVGDAPQPGDSEGGDPFTGEAGRLLDNMLRAMGLVRGPGVCVTAAPLSARQIAQVQPRVILVMGRAAAQSLLRSNEPIGRLRGQVHDVAGVPTVVTYPPAYLLRNLPDKARAWADLCLAMGLMERGAD